jgi:DNA recombination protein RmuC
MIEFALVGLVAFLAGAAVVFALLKKSRQETRYQLERLNVRVAEADALLRAEREKTVWTQDARQQFKDAFKSLATDELEAKAAQLKTTAKEELGGVVGPLKEELDKLDKHVRDLESKREGAYSAIGTQLDGLHKLQSSLKEQTTTLAQALKAPTVRGRWGEIHLRRLVELCGLEKQVDFSEQQGTQSSRPDMIVRLPERGIIPVDSKVPLDAFLKAMEAETEDARKALLAQHAQAFRARVVELSRRSYWDQFETMPEIVVMFVPVEASVSAAFLADRDLFEDAFQNKVLITSPISLFALLKAIAFGWQQQQVTENAEQIAAQGKTVYERLAGFIGHLSGVGKSLESGVKKYNDAIGSLETRVMPSVRKLKELGVGSAEIEAPQPVESQARLALSADDAKVVRLPESRSD